MMKFFSDIVREEFDKITPLQMSTFELSDNIAERIYTIMKRKGISNSQLAKMTGRRPSEVTKWLGGGHNFTCKTIVLISNALGEDLIRVVKTKK